MRSPIIATLALSPLLLLAGCGSAEPEANAEPLKNIEPLEATTKTSADADALPDAPPRSGTTQEVYADPSGAFLAITEKGSGPVVENYTDEQMEAYGDAIQGFLDADYRAWRSNLKTGASPRTLTNYALALSNIKCEDCPPEFRRALQEHKNAWLKTLYPFQTPGATVPEGYRDAILQLADTYVESKVNSTGLNLEIGNSWREMAHITTVFGIDEMPGLDDTPGPLPREGKSR